LPSSVLLLGAWERDHHIIKRIKNFLSYGAWNVKITNASPVLNPSVTNTNSPEYDRDAGENLIAESSDRASEDGDPNPLNRP